MGWVGVAVEGLTVAGVAATPPMRVTFLLDKAVRNNALAQL
jgi:hypothetical protein